LSQNFYHQLKTLALSFHGITRPTEKKKTPCLILLVISGPFVIYLEKSLITFTVKQVFFGCCQVPSFWEKKKQQQF